MAMIRMGCYRVTSITRRRKVKKLLGRRSIASFKDLQVVAKCQDVNGYSQLLLKSQ
jgi:hypothetical protein